MKRLFSAVLMFIMASVLFTGCNLNNVGVEGLLAAPSISKQQEKIYNALTESTGKNIQLKYPQSGVNRSAIIIDNFDSDNTDEALVFYKKTNTSGSDVSLRINVLDQINGKWQSVYDAPAPTEDIDKVIISRIGAANDIYITIGFGLSTQIDKKFIVYRYNNGILNAVYDDSYSQLEIMDMDMDNQNDIVTIYRDSLTQRFTAKVEKLFTGDVNNKSELTVELSQDTSDFTNMVAGKIGNGIKALYIDAVKGDGTLHTEVVGIENGVLKNFINTPEASLKTTRPAGFASCDIDKNGEIDIPYTKPFVGYETVTNSKNVVMLTEWRTVDADGNLKKNVSSYYSNKNSYVFILPGSWDKLVTAKVDTGKSEIVFYKYEGDMNDKMTELLRILVVPHKDSDKYLHKGYERLRTKGQIDYLFRLSENKDESLILTRAMLEDSFIVLN